MFLAAGSWAIVALALWLAMFFGSLQLPTRFDPLAWHVHEMLFGFVMAAVAGFLLTAIPNWTGRLLVRGYLLAALVGLWLLGRHCLLGFHRPSYDGWRSLFWQFPLPSSPSPLAKKSSAGTGAICR